MGNSAYNGGGVWGMTDVFCTITGCTFFGNSTLHYGGAMHWRSGAVPVVTACTFYNNSAAQGGGGVHCRSGSAVTLTSCTLAGNAAPTGAGVLCSDVAPVLENCIIAFGTEGEAVACSNDSSVPTMTCCDLYGNVGGDWVGRVASLYGTSGNISGDPLFCDVTITDFTLASDSPCLPDGNECHILIGAHGWGCEETPVEATSWGSIKAMFR